MIIVQVKEGENIERALKKFKRKFEKTGIVKELRSRQAFEKPSVANRKKMMIVTVVPFPRALLIWISPCIICTMFSTIGMPSPGPSIFLMHGLSAR